MSTKKQAIIDKLNRLEQMSDADDLLCAWDEAHQYLAWLVENQFFAETADLAKACTRSFMAYKNHDLQVTQRVIRAFPVNSTDTLRFLGLNDALDEYLINNKLRVEHMTQSDQDGYRHVLRWALTKKDLPLIAKVTRRISDDLTQRHARHRMFWGCATHGMLGRLTQSDTPAVDLGGEIDETLAGLMVSNMEHKSQATDMVDIARFGLRKTLLKMLECGLFFRDCDFTDEQLAIVMAGLPAEPTAKELAWILHGLDNITVAKKILFDPSVDIQEFIETLRNAKFGGLSSALNFKTLQYFRPILNSYSLNTTESRRRASLLINAVFDEHNPERTHTRKLIDSLRSWGFDEFVFKLCYQTKGFLLEEDLGM